MATWSSAYITDLPDSAFGCVNASGRHYPHHDASGKLDLPHLRAALSRIGDASNEQCGKGHLQSHADANLGKALLPVKAQPMDDDESVAWFEGRIPRRILSIPFGGPIPSPKFAKGVDLDGETFTEGTDIYGPFDGLRQTRERFGDWHHAMLPPSPKHGDPTGMMAGHMIGKSILDPDPQEDGWWSDFWFKAGEKRVALIAALAKRGAQLYGSSQPTPKGVVIDDSGEIKVWPHLYQTLTTSPQNTYAVLRPKAMLDELDSAELSVSPVLRGLLAELDALGAELPRSASVAVKAGSVSISDALASWEETRDLLRKGQP